MENDKNTFTYVYSAKQQEEIKMIRSKYLPKEEDKMEQLRKLDQSATEKGMIVSLILGVTGTLVFGIGLCCCLVWNQMGLGILCGLVGILGIGSAYPAYSKITEKQRAKIAPEIIRLTDELMK